MKSYILATTFALFAYVQAAQADLITSAGTHSFLDGKVVVNVVGAEKEKLNFTMTFDAPDFKGRTGTGKDSPMQVVPTQWAAQFVAPNELWVFDGLGKVTLFERTIHPSGFKGSDSSVIPDLIERTPEKLRLFMAKSTQSGASPAQE